MAAGDEVDADMEGPPDKENYTVNYQFPQDTINPAKIQSAIAEIKKSFTRNRKVRMKLLFRINEKFFSKVSQLVEEDPSGQRLIIEYMEDITQLILECINLCLLLSEPRDKIREVFDAVVELSSHVESIVLAAFTWCKNNNRVFGQVVGKLLNEMINVSCEDPETWLYSVVTAPSVLHILNAFFQDDHSKFRTEWAKKVIDVMRAIPNAVYRCGDYGCQFYLMTVFRAWIQWIHSGTAIPMVHAAFSFVDQPVRKELLIGNNSEAGVVRFLNSFNLALRGPHTVIPIESLYLFAGEHQLNRDSTFWVDFSIGSGRLQASFLTSASNRRTPLCIRKDQIHSICINWVVNNGQSLETQNIMGSEPMSPSTFSKDEKVLFFHIVLNTSVNMFHDDENLPGTETKSLYFIFLNGQLVEKVMKEMGYHLHICGSMNCERPRSLRQTLASRNKLSYTSSWCPESQVVGLDNSGISRSSLAENIPPNEMSPSETYSEAFELTDRFSSDRVSHISISTDDTMNTPSGTSMSKAMTYSNNSLKSPSISTIYSPDATSTSGVTLAESSLQNSTSDMHSPSVIPPDSPTMSSIVCSPNTMRERVRLSGNSMSSNNITPKRKIIRKSTPKTTPLSRCKSRKSPGRTPKKRKRPSSMLTSSPVESVYEAPRSPSVSPVVGSEISRSGPASIPSPNAYESPFFGFSKPLLETSNVEQVTSRASISSSSDVLESPEALDLDNTAISSIYADAIPNRIESDPYIDKTEEEISKTSLKSNSVSILIDEEEDQLSSAGPDMETMASPKTPIKTVQTPSTPGSPVIGFSKPLEEKSILDITATSIAPNKSPCYANASLTKINREKEKSMERDYDPYDMAICSDFEELKEKLFPLLKLKTYPGAKKRSREITVTVRRNKKLKRLR